MPGSVPSAMDRCSTARTVGDPLLSRRIYAAPPTQRTDPAKPRRTLQPVVPLHGGDAYGGGRQSQTSWRRDRILPILHTWSQNLLFHPHFHCVVPSGGLAPGRTHWIRGSATFFLPLEVLQQVFRGKFVDGLEQAFAENRLSFSGLIQHLAEAKSFAEFVRKLHRNQWVVYTKPSFGGPERVLRYLGRYTHRVAISNHRLISFDGDHVRFRWRDYAHGNKKRKMTLSAEEFIRRFLLHVLPKGFVRIRHCGFMANYQRSASLNICRQLLDMAPIVRSTEITSTSSARLCPTCHGPITVVERLNAVQLRWRFVSKCFSDSS